MEFKVVTISAATPYERGVQHGQAARDLIERGIARYQEHFLKSEQAPWSLVRQKAMGFVPFLEREYEDLLEEIRGIAGGSGVDFEDMMVLNTRYELLKFPIQECTTFAVLPEASADHHTYLGMNWDNVGWMRDSSLLLKVDEQNGTRYFCMTEAGQLIRHGFNNHGVAVVTNNLLSTGDTDQPGVPTNFMRRRILTSKTLEEAVQSVRNAPRAVSCNLMAASAEGNAVDMEVNPVRLSELHPTGGILTHANHFATNRDICRSKGGNFRDVRLYSLLEQRRGSIDPAFITHCLKDHYKAGPASHEAICKHTPQAGESVGQAPASCSVTIASQIYDLDAREALVCCGNPCTGSYTKYTL